jgi:hypothetical protein
MPDVLDVTSPPSSVLSRVEFSYPLEPSGERGHTPTVIVAELNSGRDDV